VEDLGISELTDEQMEELCTTAEEAARKHVLSKVPSKKIETLDISVEVEGIKPLNLTVDINIQLSPLIKNFDVQKLADEAMNEAFVSAEKYLMEFACRSKK